MLKKLSLFLFSQPTNFRCRHRLISEVLGKDAGDKVPIEKVVMIIWQFRDDPQVVKFMTRFVGKVRQGNGYVSYFVM